MELSEILKNILIARVDVEPMNTEVSVTQLCPALCDSMHCSPPGSSVHRILQAKILGWVAISFSGGSSRAKDQIQVSCIAGRLFIIRTTREAQVAWKERPNHKMMTDEVRQV